MSSASIKAAIKGLLTSGGSPLFEEENVFTEEPRLRPGGNPSAIIWDMPTSEKRAATGLKQTIRPIVTHVLFYTDTDADPAFTGLLDAIEALYRANSSLHAANTDVTPLHVFGEEMKVARVTSIADKGVVFMQANITNNVYEWTNA